MVAEGYTGIYDGQPHGINVTATEGGIVMYGTTTETYDRDESPAYTNAGEYTVYYRVYYQVSKNRYEILEVGSEIVTITKAPLTVTADDSSMEEGSELPVLTVTYDGWKNLLPQQPQRHKAPWVSIRLQFLVEKRSTTVSSM